MRKSYLWAGLFAAVAVGWLFHDRIIPAKYLATAGKPEAVVENKPTARPFQVVVQEFVARPRHAVVRLRGHTKASRSITVRARTGGIVEASPRREGDEVKAGQILCRLDDANRPALEAKARADLAAARRDYAAAQRLAQRNFASQAKLAAEKARLDAAVAALDQVKWDISWTRIAAPRRGIIAERPAEVGSYLRPGDVCARLIVLDPVRIAGAASEQEVAALKEGMRAQISLVGGRKIEGRVVYIAPAADAATRTFQVEVEAANPGNRIRAGLTARIDIALKPRLAHLLPASAIGLDDTGRLGVWSLDEGSVVRFMPVKVIAQTRQGAWVSGLAERSRVIVRGQHYVLDGQKVEAVSAPATQDTPQS